MEEKEEKGGALEPQEESAKLDRKEFLKAVGAGIGVIALGAVPGGDASASTGRTTEMAPVVGGRRGIQRLVRHLVENPEKANEFLMHPVQVAEELGIVVDAGEMDVIRNAIRELKEGGDSQFLIAKETKPPVKTQPHQHVEFPECKHIEVPRPKPK